MADAFDAILKHMGTYERTLAKILKQHEPDVPYCAWTGQKLLTGVETKHRTRSGVKYNRLIRLHWRTQNGNSSRHQD